MFVAIVPTRFMPTCVELSTLESVCQLGVRCSGLEYSAPHKSFSAANFTMDIFAFLVFLIFWQGHCSQVFAFSTLPFGPPTTWKEETVTDSTLVKSSSTSLPLYTLDASALNQLFAQYMSNIFTGEYQQSNGSEQSLIAMKSPHSQIVINGNLIQYIFNLDHSKCSHSQNSSTSVSSNLPIKANPNLPVSAATSVPMLTKAITISIHQDTHSTYPSLVPSKRIPLTTKPNLKSLITSKPLKSTVSPINVTLWNPLTKSTVTRVSSTPAIAHEITKQSPAVTKYTLSSLPFINSTQSQRFPISIDLSTHADSNQNKMSQSNSPTSPSNHATVSGQVMTTNRTLASVSSFVTRTPPSLITDKLPGTSVKSISTVTSQPSTTESSTLSLPLITSTSSTSAPDFTSGPALILTTTNSDRSKSSFSQLATLSTIAISESLTPTAVPTITTTSEQFQSTQSASSAITKDTTWHATEPMIPLTTEAATTLPEITLTTKIILNQSTEANSSKSNIFSSTITPMASSSSSAPFTTTSDSALFTSTQSSITEATTGTLKNQTFATSSTLGTSLSSFINSTLTNVDQNMTTITRIPVPISESMNEISKKGSLKKKPSGQKTVTRFPSPVVSWHRNQSTTLPPTRAQSSVQQTRLRPKPTTSSFTRFIVPAALSTASLPSSTRRIPSFVLPNADEFFQLKRKFFENKKKLLQQLFSMPTTSTTTKRPLHMYPSLAQWIMGAGR